MQPAELKAVLTKTDEVAVWPHHIETEVPYALSPKALKRSCPTHLVKAKVIRDGVDWIERRPIGACGDTDYEIPHHNGVLVEFDLATLNEQDENSQWKVGKTVIQKQYHASGWYAYPHSESVKREGKQFIHMIISRKFIITSWAEYMLISAQRQKEIEERQEKRDRLRRPQAMLMGYRNDLVFYDLNEVRARYGNLQTGYEKIFTDAKGRRLHRNNQKEVGKIEIGLERAEELVEMLKEIAAMIDHLPLDQKIISATTIEKIKKEFGDRQRANVR